MIPIESLPLLNTLSIIQDNVEWMLSILKYLGLSFSSLFLFLFIIWLIVDVVFAILREIPLFKGFLYAIHYLMFPGSLMKNVWRVFVLKKLNYVTEEAVSFNFVWMRYGITVKQPFKSMRDSMLFFYSPAINILVIIIWVIPGALLFEWFDSLIDHTVFYWIWLYFLLSFVMTGLPELYDLFAPIQTSVAKTPEFYIFIMFYVILAPLTLVLWGWGITVIFSLFYIITAIYEVEKISRKETHRLSLAFSKYFKKTEKPQIISPQIILTDKET